MQFRDLETTIFNGVFIVSMKNQGAQSELFRSTKTPEEVYRMSISYGWGDKYAKTYVLTTGRATSSNATGGLFQIKMEPVRAIRGVYRKTGNANEDRTEGGQNSEEQCIKKEMVLQLRPAWFHTRAYDEMSRKKRNLKLLSANRTLRKF